MTGANAALVGSAFDPVASVLHLMHALLESSGAGHSRLQAINLFSVLGYLLERVPSVYLTNAAFDAVLELVNSGLVPDGDNAVHAAYKQVLFNFNVWTRASRPVQLYVCQRLHTVTCNDRARVCRALGGILPVLHTLWQQFGYAKPALSPSNGHTTPSSTAAEGSAATVVETESALHNDAAAAAAAAAPVATPTGDRDGEEDAGETALPVIRKFLFMIIAEMLQQSDMAMHVALVLKGLTRLRYPRAGPAAVHGGLGDDRGVMHTIPEHDVEREHSPADTGVANSPVNVDDSERGVAGAGRGRGDSGDGDGEETAAVPTLINDVAASRLSGVVPPLAPTQGSSAGGASDSGAGSGGGT